MPGANALDAADGAKKLMEKIKQSFPPDLDYVIALDTTLSVTEGIKEIKHTLFEALVLVMIVVFVFLQGWRATLIPAAGGAGVAGRHLHAVPDVRLLDQHAVAVRPGAGDRPRGR
jgi:hypothetical protein